MYHTWIVGALDSAKCAVSQLIAKKWHFLSRNSKYSTLLLNVMMTFRWKIFAFVLYNYIHVYTQCKNVYIEVPMNWLRIFRVYCSNKVFSNLLFKRIIAYLYLFSRRSVCVANC